jgi:hypothetical protein
MQALDSLQKKDSVGWMTNIIEAVASLTYLFCEKLPLVRVRILSF